MKKKLLSSVKYVFFLAIGLLLVWWQLGSLSPQEKQEFYQSLKNTRLNYMVPIFIMAVASHYSRAIRWKLLLEPMGYQPKLSNTFYATLTGYLGNLFVPRAGEVLRCSMMTKYEQVPFTKALGTAIVERLVDVICLVVLIVATVLIQMDTVSDFVTGNLSRIGRSSATPLWLKLLIVASVGLALFLAVRWFVRKYAGGRINAKIAFIIAELREGLYAIIHLKKRRAFLFHTVAIWTLYLLQVWVGFRAMAETEHLGMPAAMSVLMLSTIAMIVSPGGIGAFPVAVQQVLLLYHLDNISFGWLMWGVNTGIILILGALSFVLLHIQNRPHERNRGHWPKNPHPGSSSPTGEKVETYR